jgi:hypothetical protein
MNVIDVLDKKQIKKEERELLSWIIKAVYRGDE